MFCGGMLLATVAVATDIDTAKTAQVQNMRRVLINCYRLTEFQAIQLTPAMNAYVAQVVKNKSTAKESFALAFQRVVGKPYNGI